MMIIAIGNSHMSAVHRAAKAAGVDTKFYTTTANIQRFDDGSNAVKPEVIEFFESVGGVVFSMVGGNAHNTFGMVRHPKPFDFIHPGYPDLAPEPKTTILPFSQIQAAMLRQARTRINEFLTVCRALPGRVVHLESPPPIRSQRYMKVGLMPRMVEAGKPDFAVSAASFRYKLWRVNSEIFRQQCEANGVPFVPVPAAACDDRGFLRREFLRNIRNADPTHANMKYGALVLEQMLVILRNGHVASI